MAGPENKGVTDENNEEERDQDIDLSLEQPKEAVSAGLNEDQIGLNARSQAELNDPTQLANFAGAPTAQTVTDDIDSTDPGYASGHDSLKAQKEQYDVALSGASKGRHAGTIFDRICEEKRYIEEQKRRSIAMVAAMTLADLLANANALGQQYADTAGEFDEVGQKVEEIEQIFDQQISEIDQEIEKQQQIIDDLKTRMENGEMSQTMQVRLDTAEAQLQALQEMRSAFDGEKSALVDDYKTSRENFDQARAKHEELTEALKNAQPDQVEALREQLKESSRALTEAQVNLSRVEARIEYANQGHGQMLAIFKEMTATNPDGTPKHDLDPDQVAANGALLTALISARSDGIIDQNDILNIQEKLNATDMSDAEKQNFNSSLAASFGGSGIGFSKDGQTYYGAEATSALDAMLAELQGDVNAADVKLDSAIEGADLAMLQLSSQRGNLEAELAEQREELERIKNGESTLALPGTDDEMVKAQLELKQAEIDNLESRLKLLDTTVGSVQEQFAETMTNYTEAHTALNALKEQRDAAAEGSAERAQLDKDVADAQGVVDNYAQSVESLSKNADLARSISNLTSKIEGKSQVCDATPEGARASAADILARTTFTNALTSAISDGTITKEEADGLNVLFDQAKIDNQSRQQFIEAFAASGGGVGTGQKDADGNDIVLTGADATAALMAQLAQVEEDIQDTTTELNSVESEIAALLAEQGEINDKLEAAKAVTSTEVSETQTIEAEAAEITSAMTYSSMSDYVLSNFKHGLVGDGDISLSEAANDPNRILTDSQNNVVYMDTDTQELYTLQKNEDGTIAIGDDGKQIKVAVSHEDTVGLYNEMFENKLLPRNFTPDGDGFMGFFQTEVASPPSEHDSFLGAAGAAVMGKMDSDQFSQVIQNAVAVQRTQEAAAKAEEAKLAEKAGTSEADVAALEGRSSEINNRLASLIATKSQLENRVAESGGNTSEDTDLESPALKTSPEMQTALHAIYEIIDNTTGTGVIKREDLDQVLADASPEFKQQVEDALERNGDKIQEPEDAPENEVADNTVSADLDNLQLASNNVYMAAFPWLGIGPFEVPQIQQSIFQPNDYGIFPAETYESFSDGPQFAATNPTDGTEPTYLETINNGTSNTPSAGERFASALTNTPSNQGTSSAEEELRLKMEEDLRMAQASPVNQGGGGGVPV